LLYRILTHPALLEKQTSPLISPSDYSSVARIKPITNCRIITATCTRLEVTNSFIQFNETYVSFVKVNPMVVLWVDQTKMIIIRKDHKMKSHTNQAIKTSMAVFLALLVLALPFSTVFAASTGTPGQPNQSCQAQPSTPGNSASAPGSAFNTSGKAGTVYAGTQPQNSKNPMSVSQYDVACFQVSQP
jgi:hypothetical protein